MVNGVKIADDWIDLTDGTLDAPFAMDEYGQDQINPEVWTGTTAAGSAIALFHCNDWTSTGGLRLGAAGVGSNTDSNWSSAYSLFCTGAPLDRLYCLQQ